jgi:hypothetical protein
MAILTYIVIYGMIRHGCYADHYIAVLPLHREKVILDPPISTYQITGGT